MLAFEVFVNGKKQCVAGIQNNESLTAIAAIAPNGPFFTVSGSVGPNGNHAKWVELESISIGDEIKIRFVNTDNIDEPLSIEKGRSK
jgi:hypothetical protein